MESKFFEVVLEYAFTALISPEISFFCYIIFFRFKIKILKISCEIEMVQAIFNQIDALFFQYLKQNLTFVVISFSHFAYCQIVRETISGKKCVKKGQLISLKFMNSEKATEIAHFGFDRPESPPFENLKLEHNSLF